MTDKTRPSLILKRASTSRSSGQWSDDNYDVLENGVIFGRIFAVPVAPHRPSLDVGERSQRRDTASGARI
jgi:hypothetical protein